MKIGIFGLGFVGNAVYKAHEVFDEIIIVDPLKGLVANTNDILECEAIFVCVPSPMRQDGSCDTSILLEVLQELKRINYRHGPIISKVTAPPAIYREYQKQFDNLVFAPEFLVASRAEQDYLEGKFSIIGGNSLVYAEKAEKVIRRGQPYLKTVKYCTIEEAAIAKYTINSFLALKVSYLNQIYDLCNAEQIDYTKVQKLLKLDGLRLGETHFDVPGPDTKRGFGGACFPKDTAAILFESEVFSAKLSIIDEAIKYNKTLRNDL